MVRNVHEQKDPTLQPWGTFRFLTWLPGWAIFLFCFSSQPRKKNLEILQLSVPPACGKFTIQQTRVVHWNHDFQRGQKLHINQNWRVSIHLANGLINSIPSSVAAQQLLVLQVMPCYMLLLCCSCFYSTCIVGEVSLLSHQRRWHIFPRVISVAYF